MSGQLSDADCIVRVQTIAGVENLLASTVVEAWSDLPAEAFDHCFDEMVEHLVYLKGGREAVENWRRDDGKGR